MHYFLHLLFQFLSLRIKQNFTMTANLDECVSPVFSEAVKFYRAASRLCRAVLAVGGVSVRP